LPNVSTSMSVLNFWKQGSLSMGDMLIRVMMIGYPQIRTVIIATMSNGVLNIDLKQSEHSPQQSSNASPILSQHLVIDLQQ